MNLAQLALQVEQPIVDGDQIAGYIIFIAVILILLGIANHGRK